MEIRIENNDDKGKLKLNTEDADLYIYTENETIGHIYDYTDREKGLANARRILQCWNNFDDLLIELETDKVIFQLIFEDHTRPRQMRSNTSAKCKDAIERITKAIANAEKGD